MKCSRHPTVEAIGLCSECGIAYCDECVETDAEAARQLQAVRRQIRLSKPFFLIPAALGVPIAFYIFIASVQSHRSISFLATALGTALFGSIFPPAVVIANYFLKGSLPLPVIVAPFVGVVLGYISWACFWGVPTLWRKQWGRHKRSFVIGELKTWVALTIMFLELPLFVGYGVFGGGIAEYRRCCRITRR